MIIGIIGNGFVGKATNQLKCKDIEILSYDLDPKLCVPEGIKIEDLLECDLIFISVPTPMKNNGECYTGIIENVVKQIKSLDYKGYIVCRSTVPVGTCDNLGICFMPEFLTEKNFINDFIDNKEWIFGVMDNNDNDFKDYITRLIKTAKKNDKIKNDDVVFISNKEAEMVKLFRNCFLATKVSFCNEIYEYCSKMNVDYEKVRSIAASDNRILNGHTFVPGHDGKRGYGGTCFPKDTHNLLFEMKRQGMKSYIINSIIDRNENVDRPEKDWNENLGRAVITNSKDVGKHKKTILIAGGCGFIGSNLCERLLKDNNKVICVDNLLTGKIDNISNIMSNDNFIFINHDITEPLNIDTSIDEIYNLACPASPPKYQLDPINTLKINFMGTMNLIELAKKNGCKILLSSTSEVYGEPKVSPQSEDYRGNVNTIGIRSCYDEGKRVAETLMSDYNRMYGVDIRIARIFNTYGPKMDKDDGRVITNFVKQSLDNLDITLYGNGEQTRSFCYIDDQLDGLISLMNSCYTKPINIGNPNEMSVKEVANKIIELTNSKSKMVYLPLPDDDPTNRKPDISLAKEILNWEPKIGLEEGLKNTILFAKSKKITEKKEL